MSSNPLDLGLHKKKKASEKQNRSSKTTCGSECIPRQVHLGGKKSSVHMDITGESPERSPLSKIPKEKTLSPEQKKGLLFAVEAATFYDGVTTF